MAENKEQILRDIVHLGVAPSVPAPAAPKVTSGPSESGAVSFMGSLPYPEPAPKPTQKGPEGIAYDFNAGIRVMVPPGNWRVRLRDLDTQSILYEADASDSLTLTRKRHFVRGRIEVERAGVVIFRHDYSARKKRVAIIMPGGTLGDNIGWFPYAARFQEQHDCELTVVVAEPIRDLFKAQYPHIRLLLQKDFEAVREEFYATYYIGLFFYDENNDWQPSDFRLVGLHRTAGHILGVDPRETPPKVTIEKADRRPIEDPYVVVAVQASSQCKYWNNPFGWHDVVVHLKKLGYRVVCIDREPVNGYGMNWTSLPNGVENETGNRPLAERARWLKHADFFVGLSSGLSWLAWAVETPVVMISGFTHPSNEFYTPYRVFSSHGCNSCWHDVRTPFQHSDFLFCPRHKDTPRHFECTRLITPEYVIQTIDRLVGERTLNQKNRLSEKGKTPSKKRA